MLVRYLMVLLLASTLRVLLLRGRLSLRLIYRSWIQPRLVRLSQRALSSSVRVGRSARRLVSFSR